MMRNIGFKITGYKPMIQTVAPAPTDNQLTSNAEPITSNGETVTT